MTIQNHYVSNLLRTSFSQNKWRDSAQLSLEYQSPLWRAIDQVFQTTSSTYIDKQTGYENSARTHLISWGVKTSLLKKIHLKSVLGEKWDRRQGQQDRGLYYFTNATLTPSSWQGYVNRFRLNWQGSEMGRRRDYDFGIGYKIAREFYPGTIDSLSFQFYNTRRDYYISMKGDLESRRGKNRRLSNYLVYPISSSLKMKQISTFYSRDTYINQRLRTAAGGNRTRENLGATSETELQFKNRFIRSTLGMLYVYESETYTFSRSMQANPFSGIPGTPDNKNRLLEIRHDLALHWGTQDSLIFQNSISRLQYDTPDTSNFDDRDELRTTHLIEWSHLFLPGFQIKIGGNVRLRHLVYLFSQKSADNNWNRIFRIYSNLAFSRSPGFSFKQRAEVLANYTDYDFEYVMQQVKSYVFREFSVTDSVSWNLFGQTRLSGYYRLEFEENGRLFWDAFAEQPLLSRQNHYYSLMVDFPILQVFRVFGGFQGYFRKEWPYKMIQNNIRRSNAPKRFRSYGPVLKIFLLGSQRKQGIVSISTLRVKNRDEKPYFINQINLQALWHF
ncbi:MAG: hypothetical protein GXO76_01455 [Calditrichaeota bacterium]|nr:hypothetical protein [Calditrichota bacterium]